MIIPPEKLGVMDFMPRRNTEANLQAEFYAEAKARGLSVFLEYSSRWNEAPGVRFDAVIFSDRRIVALVEIKRTPDPDKRRRTWPKSAQGRKYLSFNLPVFFIVQPSDFLDVWSWAEASGLIQPSPLPGALRAG